MLIFTKMADILKIGTVMFLCSMFFSKIGLPAAVILFKFNFVKVFLVSCSGAIIGTVFYTYLSAGIINWWEYYKIKKNLFRNKKVFTKFNRRIIYVKNKFGLMGIAALTPLILSIPLGAFIAERFYKKKSKVIIAISSWVLIWFVVFYFIYYYFYDFFKGWIF